MSTKRAEGHQHADQDPLDPKLPWTRLEVALEATGLLGLAAWLVVIQLAYRLGEQPDKTSNALSDSLIPIALAVAWLLRHWVPSPGYGWWRPVAFTPENAPRQRHIDRQVMLWVQVEVMWGMALVQLSTMTEKLDLPGTFFGDELALAAAIALFGSLFVTLGVALWRARKLR